MILSLSAFGVFGFLNIGFMNHDVSHFCPVSLMRGDDCPPINNALALANYHVSGLQDLTRGIISFSPGAVMLFALLFVLLASILRIFKQEVFSGLKLGPVRYHFSEMEESATTVANRFLCWLALFKRRDPETRLLRCVIWPD